MPSSQSGTVFPLLNMPMITGFSGSIISILNVQEPGSQGLTWGIDQVEQVWQGSRNYINTLRIVTTNAYIGPAAIMSILEGLGVIIGATYMFPLPEAGAGANPASGAPTEIDTGSFIQSVNIASEADDGRSWIATISYGPYDVWHELGNTNATYGSFSPADFPNIVKWSTAKYQRFYPIDCQGNPFINTAGDPLENPPSREESTQCLTIFFWAQEYDEPFNQTYRDTINSDTFLGFAPYTVKCKDIDGERIYTADYGYVWRIRYEFEVRVIAITTSNGMQYYSGWQDLILNAGFRAFGGNTGVPGPLATIFINGVPPLSPLLLNQNGTCSIVPNAAAVTALNGSNQIYLSFVNYPLSTFADLNIPDDILDQNQ